jgi:hypothetical protein
MPEPGVRLDEIEQKAKLAAAEEAKKNDQRLEAQCVPLPQLLRHPHHSFSHSHTLQRLNNETMRLLSGYSGYHVLVRDTDPAVKVEGKGKNSPKKKRACSPADFGTSLVVITLPNSNSFYVVDEIIHIEKHFSVDRSTLLPQGPVLEVVAPVKGKQPGVILAEATGELVFLQFEGSYCDVQVRLTFLPNPTHPTHPPTQPPDHHPNTPAPFPISHLFL